MPAQHLIEDARQNAGGTANPAIAITIPLRVMGAVTLGLVALVLVALATWSVDDPSFSYASGNPAKNWLGFPGAVIADLSFQVLGLGIFVFLVPPALWGWAMFRRRMPSRMALRVPAWIGALVLACGVAGFIAAPETWPLPTGLGGLIGQSFTNLAILATGESPQPVTAVLFAIIIAAPALALFWLAMGLGKVTLPELPKAGAKAKAAGKSGRVQPVETADDDAPERDSVFDVILGAAVHMGFSARHALKRAGLKLAERRAAEKEAEAWRGEAVEPSLQGHARTPNIPSVEPDMGLESVLDDFGVRGEIINVRPGPVVTLYELEPAPGIKSSRVIGLADDIARSMSAIAARVAVVPGRNAIGIELPNEQRETVYLREMLASTDFEKSKAQAADLPRQDDRRRAGHRRSGQDAAPARRRHHRLGQVGGASTP
jgi:DNA segregation ATPase FtsK/SpoIIIE-like protein